MCFVHGRPLTVLDNKQVLRKGQLNRHTRYRPATTTRNTGQTGAVTAVAPLGGLILSLSGVKSSQVKSSVNALRL